MCFMTKKCKIFLINVWIHGVHLVMWYIHWKYIFYFTGTINTLFSLYCSNLHCHIYQTAWYFYYIAISILVRWFLYQLKHSQFLSKWDLISIICGWIWKLNLKVILLKMATGNHINKNILLFIGLSPLYVLIKQTFIASNIVLQYHLLWLVADCLLALGIPDMLPVCRY